MSVTKDDMNGSLRKVSCEAIHHCSADAVCLPNVRFRAWIKIIHYGIKTELLKSLMAGYTNHYAIKDWTEDYRADISIEGCCRAGEITGRCTTGRVLTKKKNLT